MNLLLLGNMNQIIEIVVLGFSKRSGLHHICVLVDDLEKSMAEMKAALTNAGVLKSRAEGDASKTS